MLFTQVFLLISVNFIVHTQFTNAAEIYEGRDLPLLRDSYDGLTQREKILLLNEHNRLRALQAKGEIPNKPSASNMIYLEWNDTVAQHAQTWADNCGGDYHGNNKRYGEGQNTAYDQRRSRLIMDAVEGWFDSEYNLLPYNQMNSDNGHYTQMVTSFTSKIGCGVNSCPENRFARLVCNFYLAGNVEVFPVFKRGQACTECPEGYGYCKDDALCASHRVCNNQDCRCTVNQDKCSINGEYQSNKCFCKCKMGWTGLNCEKPCEDDSNKGCGEREVFCRPSRRNSDFMDVILHCPATCGLCQAACEDKITGCEGFRHYCDFETHKRYERYMRHNCRKICGLCN